ncbi:hypothetical protein RFI_38722, partial [Reticulomyxa filosa]
NFRNYNQKKKWHLRMSLNFSETEIIRWMNNESELVEKIEQYEKYKNVDAARTEKVFNYLKELETKKKQGTLKQDLGKALNSVEHYLRCYCKLVQNQFRSLDYTEIVTISKTDMNEFLQIK